MPWHIEQRNDHFVVVKDADDSVVGRHESRVKAIRQLRTLFASEDDVIAGGGFTAPAQPMHTIPASKAGSDCPPGHHKMPDGSCMADDKMSSYEVTQTAEPVAMEAQTAPWEGVLTVEGIESGDGRMFKMGSLSWDLTPADGMPLMWQRVTSHGGQGDESVRVGSVTQVWREPDPGGRPDVAIIKGRGFLDLGNPDGAEVHRRMKAGVMSGNSVDVDSVKDANVEFVYDQPTAGQAPAQPGQPAQPVDINSMFKKPQMTIYNAGRVRGTTMVEFPAFTEARLSLINDDVVASALGEFHVPVLEALREVMARPISSDELEDREDALVAASHVMEFTDTPPREWFDEPTDVTPHGALTITDSGRLYGWLAPAKVHHRSFHDRTVYAPMGKVDYSRFMSGETIVSDGGRVVTGPITMNCDHATTQRPITAGQAQEHYDNSCSLFATVRVGESKNGVWVAGAVLPDVTPAMIQRAMACKLSGDWRANQDRPGWRELTAALLVPVPGFPMARVASSVRLEEGQLVAAAVPVRFVHDENGVPEFTTVEERRALALRVAKSINRDPASRFAAVKERVSFRQFSEPERKTLAGSGDALPDGSFPIVTVSDLKNAIHAYGRANPEKRAAVRAHIMKKAASLGQTRLIPRKWLGGSTLAFHGRHNQDSHGNWADDDIPGDHKRGAPKAGKYGDFTDSELETKTSQVRADYHAAGRNLQMKKARRLENELSDLRGEAIRRKSASKSGDYDPENGPPMKPVGKIGPHDPNYDPENGPPPKPLPKGNLPRKPHGAGIDLMKVSNMNDINHLSGVDVGELRRAVRKAAAEPDLHRYSGEVAAVKRLQKLIDDWDKSHPANPEG